MIKDKFLETAREYRMFEPGDCVLAAVSGGVDSLALLYLLHSFAPELKITLSVAHLNHLIRKGDAEQDANFVAAAARKLGLPVAIESFDVPAFAAQKKLNLEEAARSARYDFLEKTAQRVGANKIAVGHTADDNIETFLMRLVRGSGMAGLCGIPPVRGKIVRPLIKIWRREIEDYVGSLKLVPRRDFTNYETKYLRNMIRLKLIPQLKIYSLNIKDIILQTVFLLTRDYLYLEAKAQETLGKLILTKGEEALELDRQQLKLLDPSLQSQVLRKAIEKVKGTLANFSFVHIQEIMDKLPTTEKWELDLPGGLCAFSRGPALVFALAKPSLPSVAPFAYPLSVPGEVEIPELGVRLRSTLVGKVSASQARALSGRIALVDLDALGKAPLVRSRRDGDRFSPLGVRGSKKVQDFFVDEKVPLEERNRVPIVEGDRQIVWVAGYRISEQAKISDRTKQAAKLELL